MMLRFSNRYLPYYGPDGVVGGAAAPAESPPASPTPAAAEPAAAAPAAPDSSTAAPAPSPAPAADGTLSASTTSAPAPSSAPAAEAAAAEPAKPESKPSLLETAKGKPDKDAKAADAKADPDAKPAPADAAKPDATKDAKTEGDKKPDAKAAEAKPDDAAKAPDPAKDATAPAPPAPLKYEAFKVPDGIKLDDKEVAKFTDIIGARQIPQEDAQRLLDLYIAERKADVEHARTEQRRVWDTLNDTWKTQTRNDPDIGGNRLETSLSMAKAFVEEYGGQDAPEILAHMTNNGMGNFLPVIRMFNKAAAALNIFEDSIVGANPIAPKMPKTAGNRGWYD